MDVTTIALVGTAVLTLVGGIWGGYGSAKGKLQQKMRQAGELITAVKDGLADDKLTKDEVQRILDEAKELLGLKQEPV